MRRLLLGLSLLMSGCAQTGAEFVPLEQGKRGEYEVVVVASGQRIEGRMVSRIEGTEVINGHEYWKVVNVASGIPGYEPSINFYRLDSGTVYTISGQHKEAAEQVYLPRDVEVGSSWSSETPEGSARYRVESREDVHMFNRTYEDCLKVVGEGKFVIEGADYLVESVAFFAAGIGGVSDVIKLKNLSAGSEVTITSTLVDEN